MSSYFRIIICFIGTAFIPTFVNAVPSSSFQSGIEAYEQGAYETAKMKFSNALETNETAAARHNLGLTEFQLENPAEAIWQLERALLLDPFNRDYREKLNIIRKQLGLTANSSEWYIRYTYLVSPSVWMIIATTGFWLLLVLLVLPRFIGKKIGLRIQIARFCSLLALTCSLLAIWLNLQYLQSGIIISNKTTPLHTAPASAAPETGFVRPGERAKFIDQHNKFYQIEAEGSATGWISEDYFRPLSD